MYPYQTQPHPAAMQAYSQQVVGLQGVAHPQLVQAQPQANTFAMGPDGALYMFVPNTTAFNGQLARPQYQHPVVTTTRSAPADSAHYDPRKPKVPERFHVSLMLYENTEEMIMFARCRDQGVSVIEILRGAPKVHDGASKAFTKPTVMNFQFSWPGYEYLCVQTTLGQNIARLHLAEFLCQTVVNWIEEMKRESVAPKAGYEQWDVRHSRYHPSNLWLWGIRKVKNYNTVWLVDLFVEP